MNVTDRISAKLTHYSEFEIEVLSMLKKKAFERPFTSKNVDGVHLLLGMS